MVPWFGGPRSYKKTTKTQLGRIQRMACLAIIDPYGSNGGPVESDSTESSDYGRGEDGTL